MGKHWVSAAGLNLGKLLFSLSTALDFTYRGLANHHHQVAYVVLAIGRGLGMDGKDLRRLCCAALLHDVGAVTTGEKVALSKFEVGEPFEHCDRGRRFLADVPQFAFLGEVLATHHDRWDGPNPSGFRRDGIPLDARIIHLADRLVVAMGDGAGDILARRDGILGRLRALGGRVFDPVLVEVLGDVSVPESFWLDLEAGDLPALLQEQAGDLLNVRIAPEELPGIAGLFARVIDAKSIFTHRHSNLVTRVAVELAARCGLSGEELLEMRVAALLHDLGKLSVPEEILEKPGKLSPAEYNIIKRHTYYTYHILRPIDGFEKIREWAAYHHERLDGAGYPFGIGAAGLDLGCRVVAVADVFAALTEDRPYRPGMDRVRVAEIIRRQVQAGALDPDVTGVLLESIDDFTSLKEL
jgi:putative nucleotidyltransferase with HDIG domain